MSRLSVAIGIAGFIGRASAGTRFRRLILFLNRVRRACFEYCRSSGSGEPVITASVVVQNG
jgi:hypothetical protein